MKLYLYAILVLGLAYSVSADAPCTSKNVGDACTDCNPSNLNCSQKFCTATGKCLPKSATPLYRPCVGKKYGDSCTMCDPSNPGCYEYSREKKCCAAGGKCISCSKLVYEPCLGKKIGATCSTCDPNDAVCIESDEIKVCTTSGKCIERINVYRPCAGKNFGEECHLCPPGNNCVESSVTKTCNERGKCIPACSGTCKASQHPNYRPCFNKRKGQSCHLCDPNDEHCVETEVQKICTARGKCVVSSQPKHLEI